MFSNSLTILAPSFPSFVRQPPQSPLSGGLLRAPLIRGVYRPETWFTPVRSMVNTLSLTTPVTTVSRSRGSNDSAFASYATEAARASPITRRPPALEAAVLQLRSTPPPQLNKLAPSFRVPPAAAAPKRAWQRFEHPTLLWQMDFKGHFPVANGRCHPLTAG